MGRTLKVVMVGGRGVGKTSILERAIFGALTTDKPYIRTIEDTYVGFIETDRGNREKVRFYDIGGLDVRTRTIPPHFHAVADAYILVYSLTDRSSFQLLVDIKKDIEKNREKKDVPFILLGNKQDLTKDRVVDSEMAESWATSEKLRHWETSIQRRQSLIEPLVFLSSKLIPQPNKPSFPQLSMGRKSKE